MSVPTPPQAEPTPYPPLGPSADRAPRPEKSGSRGGLVAGIIVGAAAVALTAGAAGGAVGYVVARDASPTTTAASVSVPVQGGSTSVVPGSIADIAERVSPSVVQLNVTGQQGAGTGSGFIISSDGYILTNNHVAGPSGSGGTIEVLFADGSKATGKLVGANPGYDLAVVKVNKTGLPAISLGASGDLKVGDAVIAVGSPLGLQGTVTSGIVSALNRPVTAGGEGETAFINAIQTDAAINPGNSGGPLLNAAGSVIGINSAIASMGSGSSGQPGSIGLGFAIPIDTAKRIANELIKTGTSTTPILGVQLDMQYDGDGARIQGVTSGGAAEAAGLQPGDVIVAIDGKPVTDSTGLVVTIRTHAAGDTVQVTVDRSGQSTVIPVTLTASKA
jgi:putative serine protease PepD